MLKKLIKALTKRAQAKRDRKTRAHLIFTGGKVRNIIPEKHESVFKVLADDGTYEGMRGGKVVRRGYVDVGNWGGIY